MPKKIYKFAPTASRNTPTLKQAIPMDNFLFPGHILQKLKEPLASEHVLTREAANNQKLSYLPAHYIIEQANSIFGFGEWSTEIMSLRQVDKTEYEKPPYNAGDKPKPMISISYLCDLKLTVHNKTSHEDTGFGNGVAGATAHGIASCIELASKEAVTDALKRCLRYYGNQFGLSLYDKTEQPQTLPEIEAARIVTDEQLKQLRELYPARGIDDEWVLAALHAEAYPHETLEVMRNDWYQLAYRVTRGFKLEEIEREWYELDIKKTLELMEASANMNMLKALFKEAWDKTTRFEDKETKLKAQQLYEKMKATFEDEK